jgi:hypothetical protein
MDYLTKLPRTHAQEALVLIRRLKFLESCVLNDSHSEYENLADVSDIQDFMYHYFRSHDTTISKFTVTYYRYQLDKLMKDESDED